MKKSWPVVALAIILFAIIGVSCFTKLSDQKQQENRTRTTPVAANNQCQTCQESPAFQGTPGWGGMLAWPNGVTALGILLTLFFIAWQALLTRQSITSSDAASKAELRAYVGVLINSANYQVRDMDTKFAGIPVLSNTGKTPAHAVRYRINAAILVEPLNPNYVFPPGQTEIGGYVLGMNTPMTMAADVADYCDAADADDILHGRGNRALYCWGTVFYKDIFGDDHETTFCHRLFFYPNPDKPGAWRVNGHYLAGRNSAT